MRHFVRFGGIAAMAFMAIGFLLTRNSFGTALPVINKASCEAAGNVCNICHLWREDGHCYASVCGAAPGVAAKACKHGAVTDCQQADVTPVLTCVGCTVWECTIEGGACTLTDPVTGASCRCPIAGGGPGGSKTAKR
jgi:hypothetical protein